MERAAQTGTQWARSCMQGTMHGMWWAQGARPDALQQAGEVGVRGRQVRVRLRVQPLRVRGGGAARAAAHFQRARPRRLHVRARRIPRLRLQSCFCQGRAVFSRSAADVCDCIASRLCRASAL